MFYQNPTAPSHVCARKANRLQTLRLPMLIFDGFTSLSYLPPSVSSPWTSSLAPSPQPSSLVLALHLDNPHICWHTFIEGLLASYIGHCNTLLDYFALFAFHPFWQCREVNRNQSPLSSHSDAGSPSILFAGPSISTL